jgi:antigen flippase
MVRIKLLAVLLGPSGVGLAGLYMSATGLVGTFAGLGIASSGVREVAEANGKSDPAKVARMIKTLRRSCWATGLLGWLVTIALSYPLSLWIFQSGDRAWPIACLGVTLLLGSVSDGQKAFLQGVRRIGDLARLNVLSTVVGTVVAVGLYAWLGEQGVVPVLVAVAVFNLAASWWYASKIEVLPVIQSYAETWHNAKRLISLGLAFMWSGLLSAGVALAIRSIIVRQLGLDANGVFQAAWGISGMFAGFILGAMGTDFYPRLTAISEDNIAINKLVNEQTEIGILLALPGIIGTLAFAPYMMQMFYTPKFLLGAELLPWFVLGIFGKVISWPMGFIQLAKGASCWFIATESVFLALHLGLSIAFLHYFGLWGVALAFTCLYATYVVGMLLVAGRLTGFRWTREVLRLLSISGLLVGAGFCSQNYISGIPAVVVGLLLFALSVIFSLRGILRRLDETHSFVRLAFRFPAVKIICAKIH